MVDQWSWSKGSRLLTIVKMIEIFDHGQDGWPCSFMVKILLSKIRSKWVPIIHILHLLTKSFKKCVSTCLSSSIIKVFKWKTTTYFWKINFSRMQNSFSRISFTEILENSREINSLAASLINSDFYMNSAPSILW